MREVQFYTTAQGYCPVGEFLESLTAKQSQKVTWVLTLIEDIPLVPANYFKKLTSTHDIWEVRIKFGSDIFRLLGFFDGGELVMLDYAFQKKTQKTPQQAIKVAEERKRDYFKRKKENE